MMLFDDNDLSRIQMYGTIFRIRNQLENLWERYAVYAPKNYKDMLLNNQCFYQRWWEMYCGVGLLNCGFKIITNDDSGGADYCIELNGRIYHIEAVAPKKGDNIIFFFLFLESIH